MGTSGQSQLQVYKDFKSFSHFEYVLTINKSNIPSYWNNLLKTFQTMVVQYCTFNENVMTESKLNEFLNLLLYF